jgi:hypothetical protein
MIYSPAPKKVTKKSQFIGFQFWCETVSADFIGFGAFSRDVDLADNKRRGLYAILALIIGARCGVLKGVEDGRRPPTLQVGHP